MVRQLYQSSGIQDSHFYHNVILNPQQVLFLKITFHTEFKNIYTKKMLHNYHLFLLTKHT